LDDDPLLFGLDIEELESKEVTEAKDYKRENIELQNKVEDLQETLKKALGALKQVNLENEESSQPKQVERKAKENRGRKQEWRKVDGKKGDREVREVREVQKKEQKNRAWRKVDHDQGYFEGYGPRYIHELMLRDKVRTCAYRDFFYENKDLIKDKVVLDVGCGTGILCLFAAKAGAKRVIGIDRADIIDKAQEIIRANKFDHVITLIKRKVEQVKLPHGIEKVDLIISEWMGYFLLFESMLPTVLYARDKWLAPGGGVYPNKAVMFMAGFEASDYHANKVDFWKDVYGFDMSCLIEDSERTAFIGSDVTTVDAKSFITNVVKLVSFDIMTARDKELDFESNFTVVVSRDHTLDGFVIWFDALFDLKCSHPITLSTSPHTPETHWKQSLFYLATAVSVKQGDKIEGILKAKRCRGYKRDYEVQLFYRITPKDGPSGAEGGGKKGMYTVQDYTIS